jgi:ATP-binding cassette, subfamily B, bacterial
VIRAWLQRRAEVIHARGEVFLLASTMRAGRLAVLSAYMMTRALVPSAFAWLGGQLVGTVLDSRPGVTPGALVGIVTGLSLLFVVEETLKCVQEALSLWVVRTVNGALRGRVMRSALSGQRVDHLFEPDVRNALGGLAGLASTSATPGSSLIGQLFVASEYLKAVAAAVLLAAMSWWWLALPVFAAGLCVRFAFRARCIRLAEVAGRHGNDRREADYFFDVGTSLAAAKEVRLFGLRQWLVHRVEDGAQRAGGAWNAELERFAIPGLVRAYAVELVVLAATITALAGQSHLRGPDMARVTAALAACLLVAGVGRFFESWDFDVEYGGAALRLVADIESRSAGLPASGGSRPSQGRPWRGIELSGVTFAYPGSAPVLSNLDLSIPAGRSLGLVGINGAGKSTLISLLAGLRHPQSGRITVDGRPLADDDTWQRDVAVLSQDFIRYESFTVAENISTGAWHHRDDLDGIRRVADQVGLGRAIDSMPRGLSTVLGPGGAGLSGGQWQRLALARILFAALHGVRFLVLDEPTASLDVAAENAFVDYFLEATQGMTMVVISHRLSTVRRMSRIAVLDGGRIAESGTHAELVAKQGAYARMFELQAARFTESDPVG